MNRNFLLWLEKGKGEFLSKNIFCGYPRAHQASRPIWVNTSFTKYSKVIYDHDEMLIDWVKSCVILIYKYEVTVFPKLEIFVKHRSLYDSLHLSVGPAEFSQLQCFSCKMTVFSKAWGLCRIIDSSFFANTSPFNLPPTTTYTWQ